MRPYMGPLDPLYAINPCGLDIEDCLITLLLA